MLFAGCDIGSLTAKAVIIEHKKEKNESRIIAHKMMRVKPTAVQSADVVMGELLSGSKLTFKDITSICSTGYGRFEIPFAAMNKTEISCHGLGAFWMDNSIRTIIDIGGQDCKAISVDSDGMIADFVMNEKCAAGTGRSLEVLSSTIGLDVKDLGPLSMKSSKKPEITNKCSIFMELEVLQLMYEGHKNTDMAYAINRAVALRVSALVQSIGVNESVCITGGVSKNAGVVSILENILKIKFKKLPHDPQLAGAIGAALFACTESGV